MTAVIRVDRAIDPTASMTVLLDDPANVRENVRL
jgi:hypothetical protein